MTGPDTLPVEKAASSLLPERIEVAGAERTWSAKWKELGCGEARAFSSCFHLFRSLTRLVSESLAPGTIGAALGWSAPPWEEILHIPLTLLNFLTLVHTLVFSLIPSC